METVTQSTEKLSDKRRVHIKQVDAFTDKPLTGNPAGVVLDAEGLSDRDMMTIAREMSVPETAFILPASTAHADLRIRWFTSTVEVPLCGHATIAGFHALAEEGLHGMEYEGTYQFRLETMSGVLPLTVRKTSTCVEVMLGLNLPVFKRAGIQKLDVMRILNITLEEFETRLPIVTDQYLYVPVRRLHTVFALQPNMFSLSQFLTNRNLSGLCVFTTETVERTSSVHSRFFAPNLGINEDPVTGSANGPLGVYLFENGVLGEGKVPQRTRRIAKPVATEPTSVEEKMLSLIAEQGDVLGRKGRVNVRLNVRGDQATAVSIGGKAVTVFDGKMLIS